MEKEKKQEEVAVENEEVVSDEDLQQFIFDDNQLSYYNEYEELYLANY